MNAVTEISSDATTHISLTDTEQRITRLKKAVQSETNGACIERAMLWTEYCRNKDNRHKSANIQIAEAVRHVLRNKTVRIYPHELIVGNFTSKRVAGFCYPELAGIQVMLEAFVLPSRRVNPLEISGKDQRRLASTIPFWLNKNVAYRAFNRWSDKLRFTLEQGQALQYRLVLPSQ